MIIYLLSILMSCFISYTI